MRLWHEDLIPKLPRPQLLGQHRECCALRGNGWKKPHATVNYVFNYDYTRLFLYHYLIMKEMKQRGYRVSPEWLDPQYRGKVCEPHAEPIDVDYEWLQQKDEPIYPEHDDAYLTECLENLRNKGIVL